MMNHSPLSSRPRVLVTGASGPAGSSLLTQLGERGIPVLGVDMAPRPHPDGLRILQCPPATAPDFVSALAAICEEYSIDLLIPTVDEELSVLAPLRTALLHRARIAVAPTAAVAIAADKWLTHRVAESSGLAVPRSLEAPTLTEEGAYWLGFPYVVRPRVARGGRGVRLETTFPPATPLRDTEMVSAFLPGTEYCAQLYLPAPGSVRRDGAVNGAGSGARGGARRRPTVVVLEKTSLASGQHGNATGVRRVEAPDVAELALAAARAVGLSGAADVDILRDTQGRPALIEINARFGAHSAHAPELLDALLEAYAPTEPASEARSTVEVTA
ncbi:hypothetical protein ACRQGP_02050 [Actinotignum sp. GS-2025b]|uniref:hypothetical protein n=1 Tax=Actinotignum sp. GS-2025b TaxID=3427275 RepID=UPI003F48C00C